jgi:hypothetical protein
LVIVVKVADDDVGGDCRGYFEHANASDDGCARFHVDCEEKVAGDG